MNRRGYPPAVRYQWLAQSNPRANWAGRTLSDGNSGFNDNATYTLLFNPQYQASNRYPNLTIDAADLAAKPYLGTSAKPATCVSNSDNTTGQTTVALFDVPTTSNAIVSIGQLMHANLSRVDGFSSSRFQTTGYTEGLTSGTNYAPAYAIGNSLVNPRIPEQFTFVDQSTALNANNQTGRTLSRVGVLYDQSYLLNQALWDSYFFSTVPATGEAKAPFPNSRMEPWEGGASSASPTSELRNYNRAATRLLVNGMFNVNSTSVAAWKAVLSGLSGESVDLVTGGTDGASSDQTTPYSRFDRPLGKAMANTVNKATENAAAYNSFRKLTDAEVDALAKSIVDSIRSRRTGRGNSYNGPFFTLGEFVNRSVNEKDATTTRGNPRLRGILQEAIDLAQVRGRSGGLNSNFNDQLSYYTTGFPVEWRSGAARGKTRNTATPYLGSTTYTAGDAELAGPVGANLPGYLSQADILAKIGPFLSTRSDTFVVRAYGESLKPNTKGVQARAWCEAVVQRVPDYVDQSDRAVRSDGDGDAGNALSPNSTSPSLNATNRNLGRRFVIVSFRWLSYDEI